MSKTFKELGIKSNDIISVSMPNFYQAVVIYLAANRNGTITTFINSMLSIEEVLGYLNHLNHLYLLIMIRIMIKMKKLEKIER